MRLQITENGFASKIASGDCSARFAAILMRPLRSRTTWAWVSADANRDSTTNSNRPRTSLHSRLIGAPRFRPRHRTTAQGPSHPRSVELLQSLARRLPRPAFAEPLQSFRSAALGSSDGVASEEAPRDRLPRRTDALQGRTGRGSRELDRTPHEDRVPKPGRPALRRRRLSAHTPARIRRGGEPDRATDAVPVQQGGAHLAYVGAMQIQGQDVP
jgi:hypothetical protein